MSFEYIIYCIYNGGKPFFIHTYDNINSAKIDLYNMIELEKKRNRPYYVDNDFFNNEYSSNVIGKYFCIKQRKVSEFKKYSELKSNYKNNNIVKFKDFI